MENKINHKVILIMSITVISILFGSLGVNVYAETLVLNQLDTPTNSSVVIGDLTISGSDTLIIGNNGMGVIGGNDTRITSPFNASNYLDFGETMSFTFNSPITSFVVDSYALGFGTTGNNMSIEAFNGTGTSLGTKIIFKGFGVDIVSLFGGEPLKQIIYTPIDFAATISVITYELLDDSTLYCGKLLSTYDEVIKGTEETDYLVGSKHNDLIFGYSGNDFIIGGYGNDCIIAGSGDDIIYGMNGDDIIYGGMGNDHINSGYGFNMIYGQDGDDILYNIDFGSQAHLDGGQGSDMCIIEGGNRTSHVVTNCELTHSQR